MKKTLIIGAIAAALLIPTPAAQAAPDIKDLLRGLGQSAGGDTESSGSQSTGLGALQGLVEGILGKSNLTEADLVGTYKYSAPAVAFKSDDLLKKAGGAAAAGVIESKLQPYYEKVGLQNLTAVFNDDNTFTFQIGKVALSGTYAKDAASENGDFIFTFQAAKKIPLGKFQAHVEKVGRKLTITFDASKLITIVNTVATISGQSSLQTVASLLNSYDGLACGFELTPATL